MIPVRVPANLMPVLANERRFTVQPGHPLYEELCPVCDGLLGETVVVLVFAGIEPGDRKPAGATAGAGVAVHAFCAGVPEREPEKPRRTVTFDVTGVDAYFALIQALEDFAVRQRDQAAWEGGHESRERWAAHADRMRAQAEAAG